MLVKIGDTTWVNTEHVISVMMLENKRTKITLVEGHYLLAEPAYRESDYQCYDRIVKALTK